MMQGRMLAEHVQTCLDAHILEVGALPAINTDAYAHQQYALLKFFLTAMVDAMWKQNIDPAATQRVLEAVIAVCVPPVHEIAERKRMQDAMVDMTEGQPLRVFLDPDLLLKRPSDD